MPRYTSTPMTLALPPFDGMVKKLVLANVIVYFAMLALGRVAPFPAVWLGLQLALRPDAVVHGFALWQLVTYGFLHGGVPHILINMLMLWIFGARLEQDFGTQWFGELYFISLIGAGVITVAAAYLPLLHLDPFGATIGASGAILGMFVAYGVFFGEEEIYFFFLLHMKVKYLVAIYILIDLVSLFMSSGNIAYAAHLGGALTGYLYAKSAPRRGYGLDFTEAWYGVRNAWYRRKRQKAAQKFEVYMRKQDKPTHLSDTESHRDPNDKRWMN